MSRDLLNPTAFQANYMHQLRQTINAYSPAHIVLGEGLQNAIDEVAEAPGARHTIEVDLDFDERSVLIRDSGRGFPNNPDLLYLGGGTKYGKRLGGLVGVGLKVVLFSSSSFRLRSRPAQAGSAPFAVEITDAYRFDDDLTPPTLTVPDSFAGDASPLDTSGTELSCRFPSTGDGGVMSSWSRLLLEVCLPGGIDSPFGKTLESGRDQGMFPNRLAGLLAAYLRRYTYAGNVRAAVGLYSNLENVTIVFRVKSPSTDE